MTLYNQTIKVRFEVAQVPTPCLGVNPNCSVAKMSTIGGVAGETKDNCMTIEESVPCNTKSGQLI